MADNAIRYGFRWVRGHAGGKSMPTIEERVVATAASFDVNGGAANVNLRKGDPVRITTTGTATLCDGNEGAGGALTPYGVCMGVKQYWDGTRMRFGPEYLPSDISWGTNRERKSIIYVCPFGGSVWEIDTDDTAAAYDTEIEFEDMIQENCDYKLWGASGESFANPRLDISTNAAATATLVLRIIGISPNVENVDFTGNYVKMHVVANLWQDPSISATGT